MYFNFFVFFSTLFNYLFDNNDSTKKLGARDLFYAEFHEEFAGVILFIIDYFPTPPD